MTETTEVKMEEIMENNREISSSGVDKQPDELTDISEEDEIPDLIVDDSEGSEGSIHEQMSQMKKKKEQKTTSSTDKEGDITGYTEVIETVESRYPNLDQFDGEEEEGNSTPWDTEENLSEQDRKYCEKIRNTKLTEQQQDGSNGGYDQHGEICTWIRLETVTVLCWMLLKHYQLLMI